MPLPRSARIFRAVALLVIALGTAAWLLLRLPGFGGVADGQRLEHMRQSPAYVQGRFENSPPYITDLAVLENFRLYTQGQVREPGFTIPVLPLAPERLRSPVQAGLRAIWFGHASVLLEIDGVRIMTDPILSERASPVQIVGPQRLHPPPMALEQLSGIDAVVISHDHFDHLDMATVRQLAQGGTH